MKRTFTLLVLTIVVVVAQAQISSTQALVEKMYETYKNRWYHTVTFRQQTEFFKDAVKQKEEIWYEAMDLRSGMLVIKFNAMDSGNGMIFRNDSLLTFADNQLKAKAFRIHDLIVLGFSVYTQAPQITLEKLKSAGYNIDTFNLEVYDGRSHYVIGEAGNAQFWIDTKTLLFTKLRKGAGTDRVQEIEFKGYQKLGEGWIETEVTFAINGQLFMREVYHDIQTPQKLPPAFYDQSMFNQIKW